MHGIQPGSRGSARILLLAGLAVVAAGALAFGLLAREGGERTSSRSEAASSTAAPASAAGGERTVTVPPRGDVPGFTYRIPQPGDEDYEDYREMLRAPELQRFLRPDAPPYYDPEWRSVIRGRRDVPVHDLRLSGAASSMNQLAEFVLLALADSDGDALEQLRVNRDEFQLICWPEFPNSRPYMRIPADEAWSFHFASMNKGSLKAFNAWAGRQFELAGLSTTGQTEYTNFTLHDGVTLSVRDVNTGERLDLGFVEAIIECRGEYKVFMYDD